jgi:hypothetical protein
MYIKIKHIKKALLIVACISLAGFNYLSFVHADNTTLTATCDKIKDSDCDGLTNTEEKLYGTDANNADTDGDGYSDGVEVKSGYDPTIPSPGDKITTSNSATTEITTSSNSNVTDKFSTNLQALVASKNGGTISTSEINTFVDSQLASSGATQITFDTLPAIDETQIKILPQQYSNLSIEDRKQKELADAKKYFESALYILIANAPESMLQAPNLASVQQELLTQISALSDQGAKGEYFIDLGNRVEIITAQLSDLEVPETMKDLHIKFLRLAKGLLVLRDTPSTIGDPIARISTIGKANAFLQMYAEFLANDFNGYFNRFKTN